MNITFKKLEYVEHTVSPEVFVREHLHTIIDMSDGYHMYTWDERTFGLYNAGVIPRELIDFNPAFKQNWDKLIPILEKIKGPL